MSDLHTGCLTIDLSAIQENWRFLGARLSSGDCGAVVKADAYGLGMKEVANALHAAGCRHFFVANWEEGAELRSLIGEGSHIFILQGFPVGSEKVFFRYHLTPVIVSVAMYQHWVQALSEGVVAPCALKVNTGMNRFGIEISELQALIANAGVLAGGQTAWLFSHFACADEPLHPLNALQLVRFKEAYRMARLQRPELRASLSNSAGIFLGAEAHFDLARPGIALYGGSPQVDQSIRMRSVVQLKLPVVQVREIAAGEFVGYGAERRVDRPTSAVVVSGGYADGMLRSLAGRGRAWFGKPLPLLGRVSMDCCIFDVSHLEPSARPKEGDMVEVLGPDLPIDEVAERAGTISYEILTRLGSRFDRRYLS